MKCRDKKLQKRDLEKHSSFLIRSFHSVTRRNPVCWCQQSNFGLCILSVVRYLIQVLWIKVNRTAKGFYLTLETFSFFQSQKVVLLRALEIDVSFLKWPIRMKQCKSLMFITCPERPHCWHRTLGSHPFMHTNDIKQTVFILYTNWILSEVSLGKTSQIYLLFI